MRDLLENLPRYYKAVAAFISLLIPFLTALSTAFSDGQVTSTEWTTILIAGGALVGGTASVYSVRNRKV